MTDAQIIELYWSRNEDAIRETEVKYDRYLTKIAHNILDDLEDSRERVNDTYLAAWNSMPPHRPSILSTYLGKITRRLSIDCFRSRNNRGRDNPCFDYYRRHHHCGDHHRFHKAPAQR